MELADNIFNLKMIVIFKIFLLVYEACEFISKTRFLVSDIFTSEKVYYLLGERDLFLINLATDLYIKSFGQSNYHSCFGSLCFG